MNRTRTLTALVFAAIVTLLTGCGGSGLPTSTTGGNTTGTSASLAATINLKASATSVKSDGSSSVTITATVLTATNSVLAGETVNFAASTGQVGAVSGTTDASGQTTFNFSAGSAGVNRTATISATVNGTTVTKSIPIQISGSTLTLSPSQTSAAAGTPVTLSVTAKDAGGVAVPGQSLRFSVSAGSGTLTAVNAITDATGMATVSFTGTAAGAAAVRVDWLDSTGTTVTASASQSFTIAAAGGAFGVTTPASSPFAVATNGTQSIVVNIPATINGTAVTQVRYATTLGTWAANGAKVYTAAVVAPATNTQVFNAGASAGNATVQIDALSSTGATLTSAFVTLSISSPSATAAAISLQSSTSVLAPSSGGTLSTATLTAVVKDASLNPVGGAAVLFELVNSSGTGESISPAVVITDSTSSATTQMGRAQATFTAGTSTTQGAMVRASLVANSGVAATTPITVGGTAGSIAIGVSTKMTAVNADTAYQLPVTVMVTDSNGNAVSGAVVSLSLWPSYYYKGVRDVNCVPHYVATGTYAALPTPTWSNWITSVFANEDYNENLIMDAADTANVAGDGPGGYVKFQTYMTDTVAGSGVPSTDFHGKVDSILWPPLSAAGSIPSSVTTGVDGTATFNWIYLKDYANWITARLRATTQVQGNQSTAAAYIELIPLVTDMVNPCSLPNSPFN